MAYRASRFRRNTASFPREETRRQLAAIAAKAKYRINYEGRVPYREYVSETLRALVVPSPFGLGEICWRDFECFLAGAALLKPDMGHLETWPDYYEPGVTYMPHSWDFADFGAKVSELLESPTLRRTIAQAGQDRYLEMVSPTGGEAFAHHFDSLVRTALRNREASGPVPTFLDSGPP